MTSVQYWVWLSTVLGAGSMYIDQIIEEFASPKNLYEAGVSGLDKLTKGDNSVIQRAKKIRLDYAFGIMENAKKLGQEIITLDSKKYPEKLRDLRDKPLVLYCIGNIECLNEHIVISIIGSRAITIYGEKATYKISNELANSGVVVVSGFAIGGDTAAHMGAIKAQGKTVAIMGCGLDVDYPKQNTQLKKIIVNNGGAIISEYPPSTPPNGENFPVRNRLISGVSTGVLVTQAAKRSGTLITASCALEQGKDIFCIPHDIFSVFGEGCNRLLLDGAKFVQSAEDILYEYEYKYKYLNNIILKEQTLINEDKKENIIMEVQKIMDKNSDIKQINKEEDKEILKVAQTSTAFLNINKAQMNNKKINYLEIYKNFTNKLSEKDILSKRKQVIKELEVEKRTKAAYKEDSLNKQINNDLKIDDEITGVISDNFLMPEYELTGNVKKVLDEMMREPKHIDEIIKNLGLTSSAVLSALTELEIEGLIISHPGNRYSRC